MSNRLIRVLLIVFMMVFIAVPAMAAIQVTTRNAEMKAGTPCDRAGDVQFSIPQSDWDALAAFVPTPANPLEIRMSLQAFQPVADADIPYLCRQIAPDAAGALQLTALNVDVSDVVVPNAIPDITVRVWATAPATAPRNKVIHILIEGLDAAARPIDQITLPWFKVGLSIFDGLGASVETSICADVHGFSLSNQLAVSHETVPAGVISFSGDDKIGHFEEQAVSLRNCDKVEDDVCPVSSIPLCTSATGQTCPQGELCLVAEGNFPPNEEYVITLRTNGAADGATTQAGVFLEQTPNVDNLALTWTYYDAAGLTVADPQDCAFQVVKAVSSTIPQSAVTDGKLQFCIPIDIDILHAVVNSTADVWVNISSQPCGVVLDSRGTGPLLIPCGDAAASACFEYVVTGIQPWVAGIAVSNLDSVTTPLAQMTVTFTITDSAGSKFTWTKSNFTTPEAFGQWGVVSSFILDQALANFTGGTPAPGGAILRIDANFPVKGYEFVFDSSTGFGGSTDSVSCGGAN